MPAFSPINENVFTTEAWILLGPPVHKLYGWLPLITVLLETCTWSGLIVACLALGRAPMCFACIVWNQQGFRLLGNSIVGVSSWVGGDANAHCGMVCFLYTGQRSREEVCVGEVLSSLLPRAGIPCADPPWQVPAHITGWCHLSGLRDCGHFNLY